MVAALKPALIRKKRRPGTIRSVIHSPALRIRSFLFGRTDVRPAQPFLVTAETGAGG